MEAGKIAFVGAEQMRDVIAETGHIALYGIQFDFDEDVVKPDSKPTLDEIAKLLSTDPALRLAVVGHTDARGGDQYNRDLSKRRAVAVAAALAHDCGVAASRLQARARVRASRLHRTILKTAARATAEWNSSASEIRKAAERSKSAVNSSGTYFSRSLVNDPCCKHEERPLGPTESGSTNRTRSEPHADPHVS